MTTAQCIVVMVGAVLMVVIVVTITMQHVKQCARHRFGHPKAPVNVMILTRSGSRRASLARLRSSLRCMLCTTDPRVVTVHHLISDDGGDTSTVAAALADSGGHDLQWPHRTTVIPVVHQVKSQKRDCPYNQYLNTLVDHAAVVDSECWIMILDDDATLLSSENPHFLQRIGRACSNARRGEILVHVVHLYPQRFKVPKALGVQFRKPLPAPGGLDMACLCLTPEVLRRFPFDHRCNGDNRLVRNAFLADVTVRCISEQVGVGVWANVAGAAHGAHIE